MLRIGTFGGTIFGEHYDLLFYAGWDERAFGVRLDEQFGGGGGHNTWRLFPTPND
jgi:hypothetical protein